MRMRFMGPCQSSIYVPPDAVVAADPCHAAAWQSLAQAVAADQHTLLRVSEQTFAQSTGALARRSIRYETVTDDTPLLPAHVLDCEVGLDEAERAGILNGAAKRLARRTDQAKDPPPTAGDIGLVPSTACLRLYYGGVMIIWFDLGTCRELEGWTATGAPSAGQIESIERLGNDLFQELALRIDAELVAVFERCGERATTEAGFPSRIASDLAAAVRRLLGLADERQPRLLPSWTLGATANPDGEPSQDSPAFWVTRSLIFAGIDGSAPTLQPWLGPVAGDNWQDEMKREGFCMPWLRYAFDEAAMERKNQRFADAWESMLFSQFFWAALEKVERRMFRCLSDINGASRPVEVRESYEHLDRAREEAELTLAHHRYLKRYLTRTRFRLANRILEGWGFTRLVDNLHNVISIARTRHEQLLQRMAARSSVFTDFLLFVIGSVAVLDFFVSLSIVGRQLASDTALGRRDEGWFDILGHLSAWRMDSVFSLAVSIVVIAAALLLWYRRRQLY